MRQKLPNLIFTKQRWGVYSFLWDYGSSLLHPVHPVHWIVPILGSIPFGSGIYLVFTSVFTFLVTAYRPIAATALASNSAMRFGFAAVFPLFAGFMYNALGTVGATALLAGIMTAVAPLPFIFRRIGARLRQNSRFAAQT
ncbi:hypothetical protein MPER_07377 [Moniliophthora perniciosa FA553]|nr:hypothetical protein MPER_07377 [Moniliophthora perniciosa FA553]